ncbi:patched domain-containing protein 3-like [Centruroides sculpturatus]|uniref:patched domain-containing protein 3-like n=1 Tax=Centruroides sculpturatus TaxID=218467 RepID=UPI000C6DDCCD|nr:patched domain-containing protein 3-like [Centruroides sculpturatus]XP_023211545.1 patched domain-containing protein 3-like [Centruroides sculpturatus]XP_023211546.1 patched domain-containing protein 3-like [Centruroides sculpturatus]
MKLNVVQQLFSKSFSHLGRKIARYPGYFIIVPFLVAGIFATGLQRLRLTKDLDTLYTATGSPAMINREYIEKLFLNDVTNNFDIGRATRMGRQTIIVVIPKDNGSVLRSKIFYQVQLLDKLIKNVTIEIDGTPYTYEDVCAKKNRKCFENEYLKLDKRIADLENGTDFLPYPLYLNNYTYEYVFYAVSLGGVTTDKDRNIINAKALRLLYFMDNSNNHKEELALLWEEKLVEFLKKLNIDLIDHSYFTSSSLENEIHRITVGLLPLYAIAVIIMLCFSILTTVSSDWIESKPWCSVLGSFSSGVAVASSFGFLGYCGLDYVDINIAVPFLMLGIGMDDTFVLLAAWRCTDKKSSVEDRLAKAYEDAAVSITVTSVTNFISFLIGITAPFPVVRIFCASAASAVLFTYLFQITFFGGCLALFGYAEEKKLHSLTFLPIKEKEETKDYNFLYRLLCTGRKSEVSTTEKGYFMMTCFKDNLGRTLSNKYIKVLVIVLFLIYFAVAVWGCTQIKEGLEFQKLAPYNSYPVKLFDNTNKYFGDYRDRIQVVINTTLDYSDPKVQDQLEELVQKFESNRFLSSDTRLTEFWLRYFKRFYTNKRTAVLFQNYNLTNKQEFIYCLRKVFLKFSVGRQVKDDLVFNENYTEIIASRFIVQSVNVNGVEEDKQLLIQLRDIASSAPFPVIVHHFLFAFYDQFLLVTKASFQSIIIAAIVMMIITFVFIPSITSVLSVAASIVSIQVGVMGYMTLWNVNLDTVSMINLIMCIGFSVDFAAHISHAYKHFSKESDPNKRMSSALYLVGLPIVQGSFSTILAILVLVTAPAYIFLVFFKVIVLVIAFAALHALFLLPVLFSIFGQISCKKNHENNGNEVKDITNEQSRKPSFIRQLSNNAVITSYNVLDKNVDNMVQNSVHKNSLRVKNSAVVNPCYVEDQLEGS